MTAINKRAAGVLMHISSLTSKVPSFIASNERSNVIILHMLAIGNLF